MSDITLKLSGNVFTGHDVNTKRPQKGDLRIKYPTTDEKPYMNVQLFDGKTWLDAIATPCEFVRYGRGPTENNKQRERLFAHLLSDCDIAHISNLDNGSIFVEIEVDNNFSDQVSTEAKTYWTGYNTPQVA